MAQKNLDLSAIRGIPLEAVLQTFGATRDPTDPKRNWRTSTRDRITVTGDKFYNHDAEEGGGGAIDLAVHLLGYDKGNAEGFRKALSELASIDRQAAINQYVIEGPKHAERIIDGTERPRINNEIPQSAPHKLPRVVKYLTEHREIPAEIIEKTIAADRLYADAFGNAVFRLQDPNLSGQNMGVELRGTLPDKPFHGTRGQEKGYFFTGTTKNKTAVFVEAAIDALSLEAIGTQPEALIISTTGSRKETLQQLAVKLKELGYQIQSGFDLDQTGDRMTKALQEALGGSVERLSPNPDHLTAYQNKAGKPGKDWNDALQGRNAIEQAKQASIEQTVIKECTR